MNEFDCPSCQATLIAGQCGDNCPFCGEDVTELASVAGSTEPKIAETASSEIPADSGSFFDEAALGASAYLKVARQTRDQAVIEILPGGPKSRSMIVFAIMWNSIVLVIGGVFFAAGDPFKDNELWFPLGIISLFILIGIFVAYLAIRMRFTKTFILLEPGRLAVQKTLLGRKSLKTFTIDENSRAELAVAYEENDQPVYRVDIETADGTAKFGTALDYTAKKWLAEGINRFIKGEIQTTEPLLVGGHPEDPDSPFGEKVVGEPAEIVDPSGVTNDEVIRIDRNENDQLWISWKLIPPCKARTVITIILAGFGSFFMLLGVGGGIAALVSAFQNGDFFEAIFALPFLFIGSIPWIVLLFVRSSRTFVRMDSQTIKLKAGWGFWGFGKSFPLDDVQNVIIADPEKSKLIRLTSRRAGGHSSVRYVEPGCVLKMDNFKSPVPLTMGQGDRVARIVGGLIQHHLNQR